MSSFECRTRSSPPDLPDTVQPWRRCSFGSRPKTKSAKQEAARYRIFNAATNAAEATDEADDESYFAVLDQAGNAAEAAAAEITGYKTYADLLEALDTRRKQS
jgi:hypothetical protein